MKIIRMAKNEIEKLKISNFTKKLYEDLLMTNL